VAAGAGRAVRRIERIRIMQRAIIVLAATVAAAALAGCGPDDAPGEAPGKQAAAKRGEDAHGHADEERGEKSKEKGKEKEGAELKLSEAEIAAAGIKVAPVALQPAHEHVVVTATIFPNEERMAHVSPRVAGRLVQVPARLGDRVRARQTLAMLDSIELGEAQSQYFQARSRLETARADFERAEGLAREQIIAQKELLRIRSEHAQARAALRAAEDKLRLLGVQPDGEGDRVVSTFALVAPFDGTIVAKDAVLGELATPDKSLFTIVDLSVLWIQASLFERDLAKVKVGADAAVTVAAYPGEPFRGRVVYVGDVMDKETRTVRARIEVPNPDGRLKPDMFATAAIETGGTVERLLVPAEAVVLVQGQPTVYVEDAHGFEPRAVQTGERSGAQIELGAGIQPGERVVVSGAYALKARAMKAQLGAGHGH